MITQQISLIDTKYLLKQEFNKMLTLSSGKTNFVFPRLKVIDKLKTYNTSKILVIQSKESDKEFLEKISGGKFITSFDGKEYWYFNKKKLKTFVLLKFNTVKCDLLSQATVSRYNKSKTIKSKWYQQFSNVYKHS